jgi:Uma2 family endonuclease
MLAYSLGSSPTAKRFTLDEYHRLAELGFFGEDDHIELIRGEIIQMVAKGTAHETCITKLIRVLPKLLGDTATVRCQSPIVLNAHSELEPDFAIVQNRDDDYLNAHPLPSEVIVVIEVSDSSLKYDREEKSSLYAEAGIQHYWMINLLDRQLEAYTSPYQTNQGKFGYRSTSIYLENQSIALPSFSDLTLDLAKVFPAQP